MKFIKPFYGCKAGEIYPTRFQVGDACPAELLDAAKADGAVKADFAKPDLPKGGKNGAATTK